MTHLNSHDLEAILSAVLVAVILLITISLCNAQGQVSNKGTADTDPWVSAYLASYNHYAPPGGNWGNLPTGQIDWDAITHLFYFAFNVKADGSLSEVKEYENMNPDRIRSVVSAGHRADKPILFTIGGWGNHDAFMKALSPQTRSNLIQNIIDIMKKWGFDGIDLDLEPIKDEDLEHYGMFVEELHQQLKKVKTRRGNRPLLTVATDSQPAFFAQNHRKFEQINLMSYDMSGAWEGWVSWHNAPVYAPLSFPGSDKPLPSIDGLVKKFLRAGVPASKLGIGIDFYGYVWSGGSGTSSGGITKPNQSWDTPPRVTDNVPYYELMENYFNREDYHWDKEAKAAWLGMDHPGTKNDKFITYDDERSIRAKFQYVFEHKLGGVIIWELGGGYRQKLPVGQRDILLQIVEEVTREKPTPPKTTQDR